ALRVRARGRVRPHGPPRRGSQLGRRGQATGGPIRPSRAGRGDRARPGVAEMKPSRALSLIAAALACGCSRVRAETPLFVESATATGLVFAHANGAAGQYYLPEPMGAGVALFDYDGDGDLDV